MTFAQDRRPYGHVAQLRPNGTLALIAITDLVPRTGDYTLANVPACMTSNFARVR